MGGVSYTVNCLITGASGFIGKPLLQLLLTQGHTVNYTARKRAPNLDSRAAFFPWDGGGEPALECMGRLDAIVHLAGEPVAQRWTPEVKQRIRDSRLLGTRHLVSAVGRLKHKPAVLVSASAIGYYGDQGDRVLTEEAEPGRGFLADVCVHWERETQRARDFGLRVVTPRISIVLGPDGGALPKMVRPFRFGLGGQLGNGRQWMPWIHIEDMVRLLRFAMDAVELSGPVNAASPHPVTNAEFTRELAALLHRPALFRVPRFALRLAMGEIAQNITDSVRVEPAVAQKHGFEFRFPRLRDCLQDCLNRAHSSGNQAPQAVTG